ncbi:hypothetical protein Slala03_14590 [Streptomyces lavendulae subsp. lavendulae]|uniref:hypothetical protein n=1 Tax=Streptomyces lavendulae TaxID=1914 RepID=UPI0024A0B2FA|nr:hypothetical protein [Streptomyces lavendulae]GLV81770.1 hypothetical protein Slala03_14590 [Streptomyces lavendulae subsp. lavendulae]
MKLKRMAIVAAAAVVGPTVLMATPAMADEVQNPAITTPDAAPAADAAAKPAAEAPATPAEAAKPAAETPAPAAETPAAKPAAETPATPAADAAKPAAETPAVPAADAAKPAAQTPAPAAKAADAADAKDAAKWVADGPKLAIKDLPSSFKAGGGWQEFTLEVDNTGGKDHKDYSLAVDLMTRTKVKDGNIALEVYLPNEEGDWDWYPAESTGSDNEFFLTFGHGAIAKDDKFDIKLRLKFSKDTPTTDIALTPAGWSNAEGDESYSADNIVESKVEGKTGGNTGNTGGHTGGGHTGGGTKPNGGTSTTPIVDHNTGTGTGTTVSTGTTTNAGGQLAETGTDAATTWALGAGGVALAMGAALVAGNGRRRRVGA